MERIIIKKSLLLPEDLKQLEHFTQDNDKEGEWLVIENFKYWYTTENPEEGKECQRRDQWTRDVKIQRFRNGLLKQFIDAFDISISMSPKSRTEELLTIDMKLYGTTMKKKVGVIITNALGQKSLKIK